jgi:hypothetical protein
VVNDGVHALFLPWRGTPWPNEATGVEGARRADRRVDEIATFSHLGTDVRAQSRAWAFSSLRWTFDYAYRDFDWRLNSASEFTRKLNASQKVQKS